MAVCFLKGVGGAGCGGGLKEGEGFEAAGEGKKGFSGVVLTCSRDFGG